MKRLASLLGLFGLAATLNSVAQGGSGTWTWTGLTAPLAQTTLFTPTANTDYSATMSISISGSGQGGSDTICGVLGWTDPQNGPQSTSWCAVDHGSGGMAGGTTEIKTQANTPVYISTNENGTQWQFAHTYNVTCGQTPMKDN